MVVNPEDSTPISYDSQIHRPFTLFDFKMSKEAPCGINLIQWLLKIGHLASQSHLYTDPTEKLPLVAHC